VKAAAPSAEQRKPKKPRAIAPVAAPARQDSPDDPAPRATPPAPDASAPLTAAPVAAVMPETPTPAPPERRALERVAAKLKTRHAAPPARDGIGPGEPSESSAPDERVRPAPPASAERPRPFRTLAQMATVTPRVTPEIAAPPAPAPAAVSSAAVSNLEPSAGSLRMAAGATLQPEGPPARMPVAPRERPAPPAGEPERRRAPVTRRLEHRLQEHALAASAASRANAQAERIPLGRSGQRLRYSLPEADLVLVAASIQAGLAAALALAGAGLLLAGRAGGAWPLALGGILGAGGWGAYALTQRERRGGAPLLISQLAALAWVLALVGPRVAVLTLAAPLALYALRAAGRRAAGLCLLAALAIYGVALALALTGIIQPSVHLSDDIAPFVDSALVALALFGALGLAMELHAAREQATAEAHARLYEQRTLRAWLAALRQRDEENVARLRAALERVLHDRPVERPDLEGAHSSLGEYVAEIAAKLDGLRRDREDRLRLEGALRRLTRAMERAWLGLPWTWPDNSDTPVDDLVALLKTPSPREMEPPALEDTPTLAQLPTLDAERRTPPIEIPALRDRQRQQGTARMPWLAPSGTEGSPALLPAPKRSAPRTSPLPWREWDEWKDWRGGRTE
jgi:hypothetical protein